MPCGDEGEEMMPPNEYDEALNSARGVSGIPSVLTAAEYRRLMHLPIRESSDALAPPPEKIRMNKTETRYAQHLEAFRAAGEVVWYAFEPMKFRLADNTHWTPDFGVQLNSLQPMAFVDVKGTRKNGKPWVEEDAQLKIKIAAKMFPMFRFCQAWFVGGKWDERWY